MGVPNDRARDLCRDPDLQRCATFALPWTASDLNLDNFIACYGRRQSDERRDLTMCNHCTSGEALIDAAIAAGRIDGSSREAFVKAFEHSPDLVVET